MIDLVVCYSILEKCKSVDAFSGDAESVEMIRQIRQHRMVVQDSLYGYILYKGENRHNKYII